MYVTPTMVLFFIFVVLPALGMFQVSLFRGNTCSPGRAFINLGGFGALVSSAGFVESVRGVVLLVIIIAVIAFTFTLIFTNVLSERRVEKRGFFHVVFCVPGVLSIMMVTNVFSTVCGPRGKVLGDVVKLFRGVRGPVL